MARTRNDRIRNLPIAVESIIAIVEAAASMVPATRPNSEHAIHRAQRAAYTRADRSADDSTDRAGGTAALA